MHGATIRFGAMCFALFLVLVTKIHMNYIETIYKCQIYSHYSESPLKSCKLVFPILIWPQNSRELKRFCATPK